MKNSIHQRPYFFWQLLPLFGCILFSLLYFIATLYYPGGTYLDKSSQGFSWTQNYWCNLLSENAINGKFNHARPIAFIAMGILALSLIIFWYLFPLKAGFKKNERYIIQASGFIAMVTGVFIFTDMHDTIINVAGFFGLIANIGTLIGLKKLGWKRLFYMGLVVIVLVGLNNLLYYEKELIFYLPVVQKITFLYFLLWICMINISWVQKTVNDKSIPANGGDIGSISY